MPYDGTQYRLATKPGVTVRTELLGNQQINGLKCWGQRTTYLFSPGTFRANQQPLTRTLEVWFAKDLGADVRIEAHDPNPEAGDQQTDLISITYADPDPAILPHPLDIQFKQRTHKSHNCLQAGPGTTGDRTLASFYNFLQFAFSTLTTAPKSIVATKKWRGFPEIRCKFWTFRRK